MTIINNLKWCRLLVCAALASMPAPVVANYAGTGCGAAGDGTVLNGEDLEQLETTVGQITIRILDIFDTETPEENKRLFRAANRLHIKTRESVIRSQLLFKTGDRYSARQLDETERLLRSSRNIRYAEVRPACLHDGNVDVEVVTQDVWTLTVAAGYSRSGGENRQRIEFEDTNLLGTGKGVTFQWKSDVDRDSSLVRYRDPQLAGTRTQLEASYADNSDGQKQSLDIVRPFFSLESRWSAALLTLSEKRDDRLYANGAVSDRFQHRIDRVEVYGGRSPGLRNGRTHRLTGGFTFERHRFEQAEGFPPASLPADRTLAYPWAGFEWLGDAFVEERNLDLIARTEDLFLGTRFNARVGWSSPAFGGDRDRLIFNSRVNRGYRTGQRHLLLMSAFSGGRLGSGGVENFRTGGKARFYLRNLGRHQFVGRFSMEFARALDPEDQLLLGGDNGLRGYPLRYQEGTRSVLLTLEQRFYGRKELFRLLHVGGAVFLDAGRAWFEHEATPAGRGVLTDVGLGLRLSPSRSGRGTMVHFDLAFPLNGDATIDNVQWLVSSRESF